jgi:hypothetical protein
VPNVDLTKGDKCKDSGKPGELQWKVGKLGQPWPNQPMTGNPSDHHIGNGEIIALYFVPKGTKLEQPPGSDQALNSINDLNGQPALPVPSTTPGASTPTASTGSGASSSTTPSGSAGSTSTSTP